MDILIKFFGVLMLALAVALVVGFLFRAFGREPEWRTLFAVALGVPAGHVLTDLLSLSGAMRYLAVGGCTALIAVIGAMFRRQRSPA